MKYKILPENSSKVLSRLETYVFVPAIVLSTFMTNFTIDMLQVSWIYFISGTFVVLISIILAIFISKLITKNKYLQKIYIYGLSFPNFAFMGIAVVKALFPEIFLEYLMFIIPFYIAIYSWAIPKLLIPNTNVDKSLRTKLKRIANPMFIAMLIGIVIGVLNFTIPFFIQTSISTLGDLMSPIAMILTGITISRIKLIDNFKNIKVYIASIIRLILLPILFLFILSILNIQYTIKVCIICAIAMPLGLNSIIVPAAYDLDTKEASSMALISHLFSVITIPFIFYLFTILIN